MNRLAPFMTLKNYDFKNLPKDIFAGVIIAAVSIPISMGYAQISGLPAVYGLYGSVLPILIFALFSTSPQFIWGVDAAPAALVGGVIASLGIVPGSEKAITVVPLLTFYTACWLLLFSILKAGKMVNYISTPVMSGFISGICCTIILMQIPKLMGNTSGTGELFELLKHIYDGLNSINVPSLILGVVALIILRFGVKFMPKFPMAIVVMIAGALLQYKIGLDKYGITMLSKVPTGLPSFKLPDFTALSITDGLGLSFTIALVITAETLLAENSYAMKNGYKLNDNREIFTFSLGNFASSLSGCCPVNGSVSRTSMGEQYGGKTQLMSVVASLTMMFILLFATGFIGYLPVPVLTAIVISALMNVVEFDLAAKLYKLDRNEFFIFVAAFFGVLLLGTVYGVIIGVVLSFISALLKAATPPRDYLGVIPGQKGFHSISRNKNVHTIEHTVIYRFSGNLFFANVNAFQQDIENALNDDTKVVIVDASGISSIDVTAAERLELLYKSLTKKGIKFFITEHISAFNDQLRKMGLGHLIEKGVCRINVETALRACGIEPPYPLVGAENIKPSTIISDSMLHEFDWAFGKDAEIQMEKHALDILKNAKPFDEHGNLHRTLINTTNEWGGLNIFDESELLERLEMHLSELSKRLGKDEQLLEERLELRRKKLSDKLMHENPEAFHKFQQRIHKLDDSLQHENPNAYAHLIEHRKRLLKRLEAKNPDLAKQIRDWYNDTENTSSK